MKRKSLLFLLLMAMFAPLAMNGQSTHSWGSSSTNSGSDRNANPFGRYYGYEYRVYLYQPNTMNGVSGDITKLEFLPSSTMSSTGGQIDVWMKSVTDITSLSSSTTFATYKSGATLVYSNSSSPSYTSGSYVSIPLSTPIAYNYSNNEYLMILVRSVANNSSGDSGSTFYYYNPANASDNTWYAKKDGSDPGENTISGFSTLNTGAYLPVIRVTYTTSTNPSISLNPAIATVVTGSTQTLTATLRNVSGTPTITYSSSNTSVATVSGSGTTATVTAVAPGTATITASMTYQGTTYTATCAITVEDPSYCTPNPSSVDGKGITTLTFGSGDYVVNNSNSNGLPASSPYYGDYTSMVGSSEAGETVTVAITYSTGSSTVYSYGTLIWVDWNKNYTFEDSEIVYTGTSAQGSNGTPQVLTATFTVPATQAADDYRMRIAGADSYFDSYIGGSTSANHSPCFSSTYAVCHDYTLRVAAASNCPTPTNLTVTNLMPTSATLNWEGEAESYNVRYRKAAHTVTLFSEGFENGIPSTWTTIDSDGDGNNWMALSEISSVYTSYSGTLSDWAHSESNAATSPSYANGVGCMNSDQWLISPQVPLQGTLRFYVASTYDDLDAYEVLLSTSGTAISNFTTTLQAMKDAPYALNEGTDDWEEVTIDLSSYSGQGYIAIHHVSNCMYFLVVDDFEIYEEVGENWTPATAENGATSKDIDGLDPEYEYEWQVQADCGSEDGQSSWSAIATFTTPDGCAVPTGLTAEVTGNAAELSWTGTTDTYNVQYREVDPTVPATIILNVPTDIWNDGSGYQLVLDADHNTYGTTIPTSGNFTAGTFADFEYTIPENAVCSTTTNTIVINGSVSITIPAGVYDYVFLNPDPNGTTYYIASSNGFSSRGDDYEFQAGKTYEFTLSIVGSNDYITPTITDNGNAWTTVNGVTNPYTLYNLNTQTQYEVQVQGVNCDGNGNPTDWSASASFTTGSGYVKHIDGYNDSSDGWYLIASPIGDVSVNNVTNLKANQFDLYYFDQTQQPNEWINYYQGSDPNFNSLQKGKGYLYANSGDVDLVFNGTAYNQSGLVNLIYSEENSDHNMWGWNLIGNPFAEEATIVDWEYMRMNDEHNEIILYDGLHSPAVAPMEGIFVHATKTGSKTVTFTKSSKGNTTTNGDRIMINISQDQKVIDRAAVRFSEGQQLPKYQLNQNSTKVYIPVDGEDFAVVRSEGVGELPVNFKAQENGNYTLSLNTEMNFGYLHLVDNMTGNDVDMLANPSYSFEARTTDYSQRFKLVFATGDNANDNFAYFSNGSFVINNEGKATLQVIDVTGRILKSESINGCANVNVNATPGIYMIRLINGDNVKVQKVFVK